MESLVEKNAIATDAEIIKKIVEGELALFEVLIKRYNGVMYKIARSYGFNHQDAEDLMQETHVAAYRNLSSFANRSTYKTWISRIMINQCLYKLNHGSSRRERPASDIINDNARPMLTPSESVSPQDISVSKEFNTVLEHALQQLPLIYRSVFVLRQVEGFSVAETASMLDISEVNVKVRFNRSKTMLQKELEQFYAGSQVYEFNLVYCDNIVTRVFEALGK